MKQIRTIGSFEIVIYDPQDKRVEEHVHSTPLYETKRIAHQLITQYNSRFSLEEGQSFSYTIARIIDNSAYNNWAVPNKEPT